MPLLSAIKKYRVMLITFSVQLFLMALFHFSALALIKDWLHNHATTEQSFLFWTIVFICSVPLLATGLLSSTFLAIVTGYFLYWNGLYYYLPAYILSAYTGYQLIKFIDRGQTMTSLKNSTKLVKIQRYMEHSPFFAVLFLRFSPIISFGQLTALCAFLNIPSGIYILASSVGMLPRTLFAIWCGIYIKTHYDNLDHYTLPEHYTPVLTGLFVISLAGVLYTYKRGISNRKTLS